MMSLARHSLGYCDKFIVVSDVHLKSPRDEASQEFFKFLDQLSEPMPLIFLGDIFDFIYGNSEFFVSYWHGFFSRCRKLSDRGFRLIFVEGNHDFGFDKNSRANCYFDIAGDIELSLDHPMLGKTILRHGDDIICTPKYVNFRRKIKSQAVEKIVGKFPHRFLNWACLTWAKYSRSHNDSYEVSREFIETCLKFLCLNHTDYVSQNSYIFGHIHIDADFLLAGHQRFITGPDWISAPSYLHCTADAVRRVFISKNAPFQAIRDEF